MPLYEIDGSTAFNNLSKSEATWPTRGQSPNRVEPQAAPTFSPSFMLAPGEAVFTIGSCFARNVERYLELKGYDVPMRRLDVVGSGIVETGEATGNVFNNYGVPSILNELEWAVDPSKPFDPATCLLEASPGKFIDLHLTSLMKAVPLENALARRARIRQGMASVARCRIVIMTLGLVEVWYDAQSMRYLNIAPPKQAVKQFPGRFTLHVMSYAEIINTLNRIVALLSEYGPKEQRIILTVSPIPLGNTFTGQDVIVANTYSKSALRAAAQEICANHKHIDYFPSYESFILSDRKIAFQDDMRHAQRSMVEFNVNRMIAAYSGRNSGSASLGRAEEEEKQKQWSTAARLYFECVQADQQDWRPRVGMARCLGELREVEKAIELLEPLRDIPEARRDVAMAFVRVARAGNNRDAFHIGAKILRDIGGLAALREIVMGAWDIGDYRTVEEVLPELYQTAPRSPLPYEYDARLSWYKGDGANAQQLIERAIEMNPNSVACYLLLADIHLQSGRKTKALEAYKRALSLNPRNREAVAGIERSQQPAKLAT